MTNDILRDRVWARLLRAATRCTLAVAAAVLAAGCCLGPVLVAVACCDRAHGVLVRLARTERRLASLERAVAVRRGPPTPEPAHAPGWTQVPCTTDEDAVVELGAGYYLIRSRALAARFDATPDVPPVHLAAVTRMGRPLGLRIEGLRAANPLATMGLREGDVLTRVDGHSLEDPSAAERALRRAVERRRVAVTLRRRGRIRTVTYIVEG